MIEEWRDVVGYEGLYQVSNLGEIKSLFRYKKILKPRETNAGYLRVQLFKNKIGKWLSVHRIVALAFVNNPCKNPQINHLDENKKNNVFTNLTWVTQKENNAYGTARERMVKNTDYKKRALSFSQAERTQSFEKPVLQINKNGDFVKRWKSAAEYCRENKKTASLISACCLGKRPFAYGFIWKFEGRNDLSVG